MTTILSAGIDTRDMRLIHRVSTVRSAALPAWPGTRPATRPGPAGWPRT